MVRCRSNYTMHFVKFAGLAPSTHYTYKVKKLKFTGLTQHSQVDPAV